MPSMESRVSVSDSGRSLLGTNQMKETQVHGANSFLSGLLCIHRLTLDFQINKKIAEEVALIPSKRIRNKVAGFVTVCSCHCLKSHRRNLLFKPQSWDAVTALVLHALPGCFRNTPV